MKNIFFFKRKPSKIWIWIPTNNTSCIGAIIYFIWDDSTRTFNFSGSQVKCINAQNIAFSFDSFEIRANRPIMNHDRKNIICVCINWFFTIIILFSSKLREFTTLNHIIRKTYILAKQILHRIYHNMQ